MNGSKDMERVNMDEPIRANGHSMKITIHLLPTRKETRRIKLEKGSSVEHAIRALGLFPDQWIPVRNDEPLPLDEMLEDGDELKLISVVSGG
jgi:sulfur carrier protein ThiS